MSHEFISGGDGVMGQSSMKIGEPYFLDFGSFEDLLTGVRVDA